jgi:pimeloyl-ACP methyl ester carboxylesterase
MDRREALKTFLALGATSTLPACGGGSRTLADSFTMKFFEANGITIRAALEGDGPLVIMVHGWPELWYSWRHQIRALSAAGYRVVAPDVRGYGESDKPYPIEAYDMVEMTSDVVGLIEALGADQAILVGHDWGAPICWNTAALYPDRVSAIAGLSVPALRRGEVSSIDLWKQAYAGRFFYQLYFQAEGIAEAELEADIRTALRKIYFSYSGDRTPEDVRAIEGKGPNATFLEGLRDPDPFPTWLTDEDLDYYAAAFTKGGFRGPLNRYRAQQRDWELLPQLSELVIEPPSCFIAGALDPVRGIVPGLDLYANAGAFCSDFRGSTIVEGGGHWIQQEKPQEVNRALLRFLDEVT